MRKRVPKLAPVRYTFRCAACPEEYSTTIDPIAPRSILNALPREWTLFCATLASLPLGLCLCPECSKTPDESKVLAALRHPLWVPP
jgi:hypothetical protein